MKATFLIGLIGLQSALAAPAAWAQQRYQNASSPPASDAAAAEQKAAAEIAANLGKLDPKDRMAAQAQGYCPVMSDSPLGAMGVPVKLTVNNEPVFVCCQGCQKKALAHPEQTLATVNKLKAMVKQQSEIAANLAKLTPEDRKLALEQRYCAVKTDSVLGAMGVPIKLNVNNQPVFLCCEGCQKKALANANQTLATVEQLKAKVKEASDVETSLAKLSPEDRQLARAQGYCVVMTDNRLGVMGAPIKVMIKGEPVFLCCKGCQKKALANPDQTLAVAAKLKAQVAANTAKE